MSIIKDIREQECAEVARYEALRRRWPCAPDGAEPSKSSGLVCATVVARAMWSRLKIKCWPKPKSADDSIAAYTWLDFREDQPGFTEALREIWTRARGSAANQPDGGVDSSFAGVCRSPAFVRAFWANPLLRLTTSHLKIGPDYRLGHVVLEGEELARQGVVTWDGLQPATVEAAVNGITRTEKDDRGNTTHVFFQNPPLIQVDLTVGVRSAQSLVEMWGFTAKTYLCDGDYRKTGRQPYVLMAVVLHRASADGSDSVRVFGKNGREQLPVTQPAPAEWPFELREPVPVGTKLTLFYISLPEDDKTPLSVQSLEAHPGMPADLQMRLETCFKAVLPPSVGRDRDVASQDTQADPGRQKWDSGRKIDAAALEFKANSMPKRRGVQALEQEAPASESGEDAARAGPQSENGRTSAQAGADQEASARLPPTGPRAGSSGPRPNRPSGVPLEAPTGPRAMRPKRQMEDNDRAEPGNAKRPRTSNNNMGTGYQTAGTLPTNPYAQGHRRPPDEGSSGHHSAQAETRSGSMPPRELRPTASRQSRHETRSRRDRRGRPPAPDQRRGSSRR